MRSYFGFSDATKNGSYVPKIIGNLPCRCSPGEGIEISTSPSFSWKCVKCKPGNFSVGGMVIDTWERWNGSLNVPGSGYRFTPFCVTVVKGGLCQGWQPSRKLYNIILPIQFGKCLLPISTHNALFIFFL